MVFICKHQATFFTVKSVCLRHLSLRDCLAEEKGKIENIEQGQHFSNDVFGKGCLVSLNEELGIEAGILSLVVSSSKFTEGA